MLSTDSGQRTLADGGRFKGGKSLVVQAVEDVELIAYHSCQPMGRGLCSKSRAAGAPRASRGLVLPREAWTRKTSPAFFATCGDRHSARGTGAA